MMISQLRPAIVLLALFVALAGLIYPLAITGIAQVVMPAKANGSLVTKGDAVIGSSLIGQPFADAKYFRGRPSATSAPDPKDDTKTVDAPYNAANSSGSNLGPTSKKLIDRVTDDVKALKEAGLTGAIPPDAVTTSGSGLDPHISPENAQSQIAGVAKARNLPEAAIRDLVTRNTEGRTLGLFGEPRVNVLALNLALDAMK